RLKRGLFRLTEPQRKGDEPMSEAYFPFCRTGRWTAGLWIRHRWVHIVQDTPVQDPADPFLFLRAMGVKPDRANKNKYFPKRKYKGLWRRCPSYEVLDLYSEFCAAQRECGV